MIVAAAGAACLAGACPEKVIPQGLHSPAVSFELRVAVRLRCSGTLDARVSSADGRDRPVRERRNQAERATDPPSAPMVPT